MNKYKVIELSSGKDRCSAWLYPPGVEELKSDQGAPCIVMANGYGLTNKDSLAGFAEVFQAAGFLVLAFEYRYLGDSSGHPRQLISNSKQLTDWKNALTYARSLAGADTSRIILWGCSYTGGHVITTASKDHDLYAAVTLVGVMDSKTVARQAMKDSKRGRKLIFAALRDAARAVVGKSRPIPIVGKPGSLAGVDEAGALQGYEKITHDGWINLFCPRTLLTGFAYRPVKRANKIRCATLIQIATHDREASPDDQFKTARKIGDLATTRTYDCTHFDVFTGETQKSVADDGVRYLTELLNSTPDVT